MLTRETGVNMLIGTNHCLSHFYSLTLPHSWSTASRQCG
jgi:hypothetical protein